MSEVLRVHLVCEGKTDEHALRAALDALLPGVRFVLTTIQPEASALGGDAGPHGGGWRGVQGWCQQRVQEAGRLRDSVALREPHLLILHLDADVAAEPDIGCVRPCPPAAPTVDALRVVLLGWVGEQEPPSRVALAVPSWSTEAWFWAALYPDDPITSDGALECRRDLAEQMVRKPEGLTRRKDGRIRKNTSAYAQHARRLTARWDEVRRLCGSAERFSVELLGALTLTRDQG